MNHQKSPSGSDLQDASDEELLRILQHRGISLDKDKMRQWVERFPSAEAVTRHLLEEKRPEGHPAPHDWEWIWPTLTVLWERWFPQHPSFEMINEKMQAGYDRMEATDSVEACTIWLELWGTLMKRMDELGIGTIDEFDEVFEGEQSVYNWMQDLQCELLNAALEDSRFHEDRIRVAEDILERYPEDPVEQGQIPVLTRRFRAMTRENCRRDITEAHARLGHVEKAESLLHLWLDQDPRWGSGWIVWSHFYAHGVGMAQDNERAAEILEEGLSVDEVRDRDTILDRLANVYEALGWEEGAREAREQRDELRKAAPQPADTRSPEPPVASIEPDMPEPGPITADRKVGRNDPCPCGSGRKYKRCCGRKGR